MTSANPIKRIDIPDGPRTIAFRAVERILRGHEVLDRVVKTWRSLEGDIDDLNEPAPDMCPMIALCPLPRADTALDASHNKINFTVAVLVAVEFGCVDDLMNLWDQVVDALRIGRAIDGQGTTVRQYLCRAGGLGPTAVNIPYLQVAAPPYTEALPLINASTGQPRTVTIGRGTVDFFFQRPN